MIITLSCGDSLSPGSDVNLDMTATRVSENLKELEQTRALIVVIMETHVCNDLRDNEIQVASFHLHRSD